MAGCRPACAAGVLQVMHLHVRLLMTSSSRQLLARWHLGCLKPCFPCVGTRALRPRRRLAGWPSVTVPACGTVSLPFNRSV